MYRNTIAGTFHGVALKNKIHFISKNFAHHSNFSGYDRLLDFIPHAPLPFFPASRFFGKKYKDEKIAACVAKWDHYGLDEINTELNVMCYPALFTKHLYHFIYGENTFCYSSDSNTRNKVLIASYHQPESWFTGLGDIRYEYFTSRVKLLDAVIAVSSDQAEFLKNFNSNVHCVHHGIDTDFYTPGTYPDRDPHLCLFVGNWLRDFETLKACSLILKSVAPEIRIQVVTPEKNRPLLEGAEVEIFTGISDSELRDKYRKASVALLPLNDCTANNSALEALACGLPVVVTDIGGIRDYLTEDCAVFCNRGNAEEMVHAILALSRDKEKLRGMGCAARKRAEEFFAWPVVAKQLANVYKSLL